MNEVILHKHPIEFDDNKFEVVWIELKLKGTILFSTLIFKD